MNKEYFQTVALGVALFALVCQSFKPVHQCDHSKCYPEPLPKCDHVKCYPEPEKIEWVTTIYRKGDSASDTNHLTSCPPSLLVPIASFPVDPISFNFNLGKPSISVPLGGGFKAEVDILDLWNMFNGEKK